MALLSRLFSSRKNSKQQINVNGDNERSTWKPLQFNRDQVRVLLFRECDWRGRKLLFDSNAVHKVLLENMSCKLRFSNRHKTDKTKKDCFVEITNGYGYQYTKPSSDATLFGEMMFGAVAMAFRGTALKVHTIPNPNRLMCTKVFPSPEAQHCRTSDRSLEDSFGSSINSMNEYFSQSGSESKLESGPLDVPCGLMSGGCSSLTGDSGYCGDFSIQTVSSLASSFWTPVASADNSGQGSLYGSEKQSGSSLSSLQRRWLRNVNTSLELGGQGQGTADELISSCNNQHHRRTRLGLSVLITLTPEQHREMELYAFEHMSVIEAMIERLRSAIEKAYLRKDMFVHLVYDGFTEMSQSLTDMFSLPRLECPMWLHLGLNAADSKRRANLSASFLQDLCQLITSLDTKATNFFVSTLVTGILTHHLGWVNTVCSDNPRQSNTSDGNTSSQSLSDLSKSNPYNPVWAQLGDLYGALGSPSKVAKTIVTSNNKKTESVSKLLTVMTYFIRCGEVKESVNLTRRDVSLLESPSSWVNIEHPDSHEAKTLSLGRLRDENLPEFTLEIRNSRPVPEAEEESKVKQSTSTSISSHSNSNGMRSSARMSSQNLVDAKTASEMHLDGNICRLGFDVIELKQSTENLGISCHNNYLFSSSTSGMSPNCHSKSHKLEPISSPLPVCLSPEHLTAPLTDEGRMSLNSRLEVLSQEMLRRKTSKKFSGHELKGGNFCSPAGVEWENDEHLASQTSSGRSSVERELTPDCSTIEKSCDGDDQLDKSRGLFDKELTEIGKFHNERVSKEPNSRQMGLDSGVRNNIGLVETDGSFSNDSDLKSSSSDGFHRNSGSMKRTHSCRTKLSNLTDASSVNLYPNINELAKMENIQLDTDSPYVDSSKNHAVCDNVQISSKPQVEVCPHEKVSKLCRVPTSAILFHLEPDDDLEYQVKPMECFNTEVMESERQMEANDWSARGLKSPSQVRKGFRDYQTDAEVVFVLGENEELKGIKHRHENVQDAASGDLTQVKSDVPTKISLINNSSFFSDACEPRIVTVKPDLIDFEVESGCLKTENNDGLYLEPPLNIFSLETGNSNNSNFISRSCSLNFPVARRNRIKKISRVCRRHTEIYCDKCKTILKEQRNLEDFTQDCDVKKALSSCEKCYYSNRKDDSVANGNFRRTKSEKLNLNLMNGEDATYSRSQEDVRFDVKSTTAIYHKPTFNPSLVKPFDELETSLREENAMFEQYNPSDEEIIVPKPQTCKTMPPDLKDFVFSDLQIIELPLPRCQTHETCILGLAGSLFGGVSNRYVPDLVLQGCCMLPIGWESALRRDLAITAKLPLMGQEITEAVCLVANANTWEVQLVSSHSYVVDKPGTLGVRVGMSQLVANMLESLNHLVQLKTPAEHCLAHMESKLRELVLRSHALAELLLTTEFCNMELLTSTLDLEANDVPLLLAIATTHSPQIATRYGLSFV